MERNILAKSKPNLNPYQGRFQNCMEKAGGGLIQPPLKNQTVEKIVLGK